MKILSIQYNNYRCFREMRLSFDTNREKNIALIVAPNGGGKTEMLFSFWWVLYGFDFASLKGKESTPYSLNSGLYHELAISKVERSETCWVELKFDHEGVVYTIRRAEKFTKARNGITSSQTVEMSYVEPNGEDSIPLTDPEAVDRRLSQIIPKKILSGIIFDGERMKQLSSEDDNSKNAVEGVIRHITNEELFELCKGQLSNITLDINNELRRLGRESGGVDLEVLTNRIQKEEEAKGTEELSRTAKKQSQEENDRILHEISLELSRHHDSKVYEERRKALKKDLDESRPRLESDIDIFYKDLLNGYQLITGKLLSDVEEDVLHDKTPLGLTVEAVDSILEMPNCICGHPLTEREKENLRSLRTKLPPVNINSTVRQMLHYARESVETTKTTLGRSYKEVKEEEGQINKLIQEIAEISTLITAGASDAIKDLEKRNNDAVILKAKLEREIAQHDKNIEEYGKRIEKLVEQRKAASKSKGASEKLTRKDEYIRKCLAALDAIDEFNKKNSLRLINERINDCYKQLSQDYIDGKRLYIVQFDKKEMYRMVTYSQKRYDDFLQKYTEDGTVATWHHLNKTDEEIKESIILNIKDSNSTGQGKINTLAFAKAILEYSREERSADSTEISRSYPFLIDSPFTELSDGNLQQSSATIHTFADQIILLISNESLSGVQDNLDPYVAQSYEIIGNAGENNSTLKS